MAIEDKVEGYLEVGRNDSLEVVLNLGRDGIGHIIFSPNQARQLAIELRKQARLAEEDYRLAADNLKPICPHCGATKDDHGCPNDPRSWITRNRTHGE